MEGQFENIEVLRIAMDRSLHASFAEVSLIPIDINVIFKPRHLSEDMQAFWGGYSVDFKLIEIHKFQKFRHEAEQLRRNALVIGTPGSGTKFEIDISPQNCPANEW